MTNREAADAMRHHHAALTAALHGAASRLDAVAAWTTARDALVGYVVLEILPHAAAEEDTVYPAVAADPLHTSLVEAMRFEHMVLRDLEAALRTADEPAAALRLAGAMDSLFTTHADKENRFLLPVLEAAPEGTLEQLLGAMQERLTPAASTRAP